MAFNRPLLCPVTVTGGQINVSSFASLQAALNALGTGGNNILNFDEGAIVYTISARLSLTNKNNWRINGNGATIKAVNDPPPTSLFSNMYITNCDDFVMENLNWDGNRDNRDNGEYGNNSNVELWECQRGSFIGCNFDNAGQDGLIFSAENAGGADAARHCYDMLVFGCGFDKCFRLGLFSRNTHNLQIRGNTFSNTYGIEPTGAIGPFCGIDIEPNAPSAIPGNTDVLIENNVFFANQRGAIQLAARGASTDATIRNNWIRGGDTHPFPSGVPTGRGSAITIAMSDTLVEDNLIEDFDQAHYGAYLTGGLVYVISSAPPANNVTINRNYFNNITQDDPVIQTHSTAGPTGSITNNRFFNCADPTINNGAGWVNTGNQVTSVSDAPTPTPPGTATLNHCIVGTGARKIVGTEQLVRQTVTNNTAFSNVLRLTHQPQTSSTYWYFAAGTVDNSSIDPNLSGKVQYRQATTLVTLGTSEFTTPAVADKTQVMWGAEVVYGAAPGVQNIDLNIACEGNTTVGMDDHRIIGIQKMPTDKYAADEPQTSSNTTLFVTKVTMTQTLTGDFLFLCFAEVGGGLTNGITIRADKGGTKYGTTQIRQITEAVPAEFRTWATAFKLTGLTGSQTVSIEYKSEAAAAVSIRRARIFALDLGEFVTNYYGEDRARITTTSALPQPRTILAPVIPKAGEHIIIGGGVLDNSSTSLPAGILLSEDGVALSTQSEVAQAAGAAYSTPFFTLDKNVLLSGTRQFRTQFNSSGGPTAGIAESFIILLDNGTRALITSLSAIIYRIGSLTTSMDAELTLPPGQKPVFIDAVLQKQFSKATGLHAVLVPTTSTVLLANLDAALQKELTVTTSLDAEIIFQGENVSNTTSLDAKLQRADNSKTVGLGALLVGVPQLLVSLDSVLQGRSGLTTSLDARLQPEGAGGLPLTCGLDAELKRSWQGIDAVITTWIPAESTDNG